MRKAIIVLSFFLAGYCIIPFIWATMEPDSSYYLKIAHNMVNGAAFFKDIGCGYTPLGMYIYSLPLYINPELSIRFLQVFQLVIVAIHCLLFYKILAQFQLSRNQKILFTLISIVALMTHQGNRFLLEPIVLLFQLATIFFIQKWQSSEKTQYLFVAGIALFLAFFSKQYALFIAPGIAYWLFTNSKNIKYFFINSLIFSAGVITVLCITGFFNYYQHQISPIEFVQRLLGLEYLSGDEIITGANYSVKKFFRSFNRFNFEFPIFAAFILFRNKIKISWKNENFIWILFALGSMAQLYFAGYRHYYQLIIPYLLLAFIALIRKFDTSEKQLRLLSYGFIYMILLLSVRFSVEVARRIKQDKNQVAIVNQLDKLDLIGKPVYLHSIRPSHYFRAKLESPNLAQIGYKYPTELKPETIHRLMPVGTYIIADTHYRSNPLFSSKYKLVAPITDRRYGEMYVLQKINN
ncbi:hypothetical protein EMN47_05455 [Prolixibacteraceae bacterium JC049]|nr:hypothetical protein [Prolixibacteraceae bacterium JC049]